MVAVRKALLLLVVESAAVTAKLGTVMVMAMLVMAMVVMAMAMVVAMAAVGMAMAMAMANVVRPMAVVVEEATAALATELAMAVERRVMATKLTMAVAIETAKSVTAQAGVKVEGSMAVSAIPMAVTVQEKMDVVMAAALAKMTVAMEGAAYGCTLRMLHNLRKWCT